ncbi:MAG: hypothetical protein IPG74_08105 [Flavobacteriales bacterium]|nr:hypothetical protein [Flavobacteriales bacterium]
MHLHTLIDHYAAYDLWANSLFVKRLDREPTEVLDHEVPSSFPTLRTTLLHIRDAEHVWLCRLNNVAHSWPAEASIEPGSLLKHNVLLRDKVAQMSETMLERTSLTRIYAAITGRAQPGKCSCTVSTTAPITAGSS